MKTFHPQLSEWSAVEDPILQGGNSSMINKKNKTDVNITLNHMDKRTAENYIGIK